jgi:beta-lactam-binding protein with PASTA domain/predicted Ser/Thr protein kinase
MAATDTLINTLFDGRYRIIRKLGTGGMANVYLAEDQELGRRVAIKILNDRHAGDEQFVERFRREAKNAAGLSHPNIVSIYDRGEAEGTYYIAMEYLDGRSLKELIVARGPAPIPLAIDYARQILAALRFAHRNGVVHRDIKPHNIMVGDEGRLKVTDFGIARAGTSQMTEVGSIIGTAQYLSPEQAKGAPVDQTSDLYSLGIVLYELLTGTVPFNGDTPVEIAMKHLSTVPPEPSTLRPEVPEDLDAIVVRSLGKTPEERYGSAEEMDADLARVARGVAISHETEEAATQILSRPTQPMPTAATVVQPRRPHPPPPVYYDYDEEPVRRRPIWPWLLALIFIALAGLAGWFAWTQVQDQLNANKVVRMPFVEGDRESLAVQKIINAGLEPVVERHPNTSQPIGFVYRQLERYGAKVSKGNPVTILVSLGAPKTTVPDLVGKSATDAVSTLANANLKAKVVKVPNDKPVDTVIAQDPKAGIRVQQGTTVRVNVSKGPTPIGVPPVIGEPYDQAASEVQAAGFGVARKDVDATEPAGTVVAQSPDAGTFAAKGSVVTLSVSKGPKTAAVPDVSNLDEGTAVDTLKASGFKVTVVRQDTTDPGEDGIVLSQTPLGGAQAKPGSTVTIVVGRLKNDNGNNP